MKKEELIAKLEGAKEVTSVVSIDLVLYALSMLEETRIVTKTEFRLTQTMFEKIMDTVVDAVDDLSNTQIADVDSADFDLTYDNMIELTTIDIDKDAITEAIRCEIDRCFDIVDDAEVEDNIVDEDPLTPSAGFIKSQIEAEHASQEE